MSLLGHLRSFCCNFVFSLYVCFCLRTFWVSEVILGLFVFILCLFVVNLCLSEDNLCLFEIIVYLFKVILGLFAIILSFCCKFVSA